MTGLTSESNVMKMITGIIMALLLWSGTTILSLSANDGMQEIHIQNGIETDKTILATQASLRERLARQESATNGLNLTLDIVIKNQDRMLAKLESK